jgi:hypothetical protein
VKGFSSVSDYEPMTLEPEQTYRVLELLGQPEYTLLLLIAATGLRMSEALGLRWMDILWEKGQIKIRQTFVHNVLQEGAKTRLSKSSVEMHPLLATVLKSWQQETLYSKPEYYVFASYKLGGKKPRVGSMIVEDYLRPAAVKAGVIRVAEDGRTFDLDGNEIKRFGFHTIPSLVGVVPDGRGRKPCSHPSHVAAHPTRHDHVIRARPQAAEACRSRHGAGGDFGRTGAKTGAGGNAAMMTVDREVVYNDHLTADCGRLTQR